MGGLETLVPTGGIAAALTLVILYLLRANTIDRRDYRAAIEACRRESREAIALLEQRIEAQVLAYRKLQELLDEQRAQRRKAEDEAGRATLAAERTAYELEQTGKELAGLRGEVKLLQAQVAEMKKS